MLLTQAEYETIIGEIAPIAFETILAMVQGELDALTLCYFNESILADAPQGLQDTLKRYLAYKVLSVSEAGGILAGIEQSPQSITVGKVNFIGNRGGNSAADRLLPLLLSYTNGTTSLLE